MGNIGLQLLSLYRDINNGKCVDEEMNMEDKHDAPSAEEMARTISLALERDNCDEANTLLNDWAMSFPLGNESSVLYHYLRVETYLRQMKTEVDDKDYVNLLNNAIGSANDFFIANSDDGHIMDDEARCLYLHLLKLTGSSDDRNLDDSKIEALEIPEILPVKHDVTPRGLIRKALKHHINKFGRISAETGHLLRSICDEFGIQEIMD